MGTSLFINYSVRKTLDSLTDMDVVIADNGNRLEPGTVYIAPSEVHLELLNNQRVRLVNGPKVCFVRPSADVAMKSAMSKPGLRIIGVVLTGMGKDGADGIVHLKQIGGVTFAQDERSSAIYGMPKAAAETGSVDFVMSPEAIQAKLIKMVGVTKAAVAH
jgi:two-component system, chemotaxis family, protein-glutamate methylesterase/glutaminase